MQDCATSGTPLLRPATGGAPAAPPSCTSALPPLPAPCWASPAMLLLRRLTSACCALSRAWANKHDAAPRGLLGCTPVSSGTASTNRSFAACSPRRLERPARRSGRTPSKSCRSRRWGASCRTHSCAALDESPGPWQDPPATRELCQQPPPADAPSSWLFGRAHLSKPATRAQHLPFALSAKVRNCPPRQQ